MAVAVGVSVAVRVGKGENVSVGRGVRVAMGEGEGGISEARKVTGWVGGREALPAVREQALMKKAAKKMEENNPRRIAINCQSPLDEIASERPQHREALVPPVSTNRKLPRSTSQAGFQLLHW
jgi:hypothetical protein